MISFFDFLKMQSAGIVKKLIIMRFKEYVPIMDMILIKFNLFEKL